jgi:NADPH2:quinone reductase
MLSKNGYAVTAMTGKAAEHDFLRGLGATEVMARPAIEDKPRPLEKSLWAAAFDSVGGAQLGWLTRTMHQHGLIASFGNAGGIELNTTVLPFILRGVRLIGVDSAQTPMPLRHQVWQRLAGDLKPRHLQRIASTIGLDDLPRQFDAVLEAQHRGRAVVKL